MNKFASLLCVLLLAGCAGVIEPKPLPGPQGRSAYAMYCFGMGRDLAACHRKAMELCPSGYTVLSQVSTPVEVPTALGDTRIVSEDTLDVVCK